MNEKNTLYIVVPCYKEQEVLPETSRRLREKMRQLMDEGKISRRSRVMFVNDGSSDNTWAIISELHEKEPEMFSGVNLSRNRGHQNALLAGLLTAVNDADMIVSMDADLQDDINAVDEMVDDYHKGYDVVYGVRSKRETDTFFKRFTAEGFYKVMKALGVDIVFNHADYRLMSRRAVEGLAQFTEVNLFLRGIVPQIGYKWTTVTYERAERFAGREQIPAQEDDRLCRRRHHQLFGQADPPRVLHRRGGVHRQPDYADLRAGRQAGGSYLRRLDLPDGLDLAHRRHSASRPRRGRRIHRQDLQRDQAPPALHHRKRAEQGG